MTLIATRLSELRNLIHKIGADYYYVPGTDPHKNEYVPLCWQRRAWISNFTGSAGDVIVGMHKAFLWTDPRYFLQAEQQLNNSLYQLMKIGQGGTPNIEEWLFQQHRPLVFATDPRLISVQQAERIKQALRKNEGKLIAVEDNLIDQIWKDRPSIPKTPIRLQPQPYIGKSTEEKLAQLRKILRSKNANTIVLNILDTIAWLFNIRGNDITYNPLVISYAIVTEKEATLFVDFDKITKEVKLKFEKISLQVKSYEAFSDALHQLSSNTTLWIDPTTTNWWIKKQLQNAIDWITQPSPITLAKAIKNPTEQQGAREAHVIDAIAMIKFLHWIETHWQKGITEITASKKLEAFRLEDSRCVDLSFSTISGFGPHSAIIHYSTTQKTNNRIDDSSLYLTDSGGQYLTGTTDITRTIHLGKPTEEQKELYTLVLKGHLAIRHTIFPKCTCGERIDALAHQFLWRKALDYGHSTGHGVGSYLCVHEGPQAITARNTYIPLQPGMILSNEPGVYLTNKYGIRIENLCLVIEKFPTDDSRTQHGPFYTFEDLTLVPYCRKLIQTKALTYEEIQQINNYHHQIYQTLKNLLPTTTLVNWLEEKTTPL